MGRETFLEQLQAAVPVIAPSMLKCDFGNLERDVAKLQSAGAPVLHLDVMDGHFVPNLTYGPVVIERMRRLTDLPLDAHLMISEPGRFLDDFLQAGCDAVTFHIEAVPEAGPLLQRIRDADVAAGLAVNPGTEVETLKPFLPLCDLILVMSVEPGFGGQSFIPSALDKLRWLRDNGKEGTLLGIDGGVNASTVGPSAEAGADVFVVGSAIFEAPDYAQAIGELVQIAADGRSSPRDPASPSVQW